MIPLGIISLLIASPQTGGWIVGICTLGYNDFNNLVMQTLWWLHNSILRHIYKKRFYVFLGRFLRFCNQSMKKVLKWPLNFFFFLNQKRCQIRWKSFEKMHQKKVNSKNVTEKCTFFVFTHVRQNCFACNFFLVHFLTTFSTDLKSAWNSAAQKIKKRIL